MRHAYKTRGTSQNLSRCSYTSLLLKVNFLELKRCHHHHLNGESSSIIYDVAINIYYVNFLLFWVLFLKRTFHISSFPHATTHLIQCQVVLCIARSVLKMSFDNIFISIRFRARMHSSNRERSRPPWRSCFITINSPTCLKLRRKICMLTENLGVQIVWWKPHGCLNRFASKRNFWLDIDMITKWKVEKLPPAVYYKGSGNFVSPCLCSIRVRWECHSKN